jgi:hypothetical protein
MPSLTRMQVCNWWGIKPAHACKYATGGGRWWSRSRASLHRVASVRMSASRRSEKLGRQQRAGVPVRAHANNLCTRSRSPDSDLLSYSFFGGMSRRDGRCMCALKRACMPSFGWPLAAPSGTHWCIVAPSVLRRVVGMSSSCVLQACNEKRVGYGICASMDLVAPWRRTWICEHTSDKVYVW